MTRVFYKKIYSHREFYKAIVVAIRSAKHMTLARRKKLISPQFRERIMLAVTEVNGCEACSYAHTRIALEQGMSPDEINDILNGETGNIPDNELVAIMFAQHYADQRGNASKESWQRLIIEYGEERARGILAAIRIMTAANIYGIAAGAVKDRLKGKPSGKTSLWYEISILLSFILYLPVAAIHALLDSIRKKSCLTFAAGYVRK